MTKQVALLERSHYIFSLYRDRYAGSVDMATKWMTMSGMEAWGCDVLEDCVLA